MKKIEINTHYTELDFVKASLLLTYRQPVNIVFTLLLLIVTAMDFIISLTPLSKSSTSFLIPLGIMLIIPVSSIFSSIQKFRKSQDYQWPVLFVFDEKSFTVEAASSESRCDLSAIQKVVKINNWLFVFRSRSVANVIPMKDIPPAALQELKALLQSANVPIDL